MDPDPNLSRHREVVSRVADTLGLLDGKGELIPLDSLMMVDFVVALEEELGIEFPVERLQPDAFDSLERVIELLAEVQRPVAG